MSAQVDTLWFLRTLNPYINLRNNVICAWQYIDLRLCWLWKELTAMSDKSFNVNYKCIFYFCIVLCIPQPSVCLWGSWFSRARTCSGTVGRRCRTRDPRSALPVSSCAGRRSGARQILSHTHGFRHTARCYNRLNIKHLRQITDGMVKY